MSAIPFWRVKLRRDSAGASRLLTLLLLAAWSSAFAAASGADHGSMSTIEHGAGTGAHGNMPGMGANPGIEKREGPSQSAQEPMGGMEMGPMQGGKPPPDARDPNAYAEGAKPAGRGGMDMADHDPHARLLLDKLEFIDPEDLLRADAHAWFGGDLNRLWLKADGERKAGRLGATRTEALWDRRFATYWSSQLGVRHDFGDGPGRTWAAFGIQGLARYWFDVEATAYVGESGRTAARLEAEYDLLLTQRVILQPNIEMNLYGKDDRARKIGSGLSDMELGLRLRYEVRREFAPYVGVSWRRKFGDTADFAGAAGEGIRSTRFVAGVRVWF